MTKAIGQRINFEERLVQRDCQRKMQNGIARMSNLTTH
jgi:hypothetical protein